jgi:hypothetical protein
MERSEGVSVVLDSIMKMMDRSGERLLRSFDGSDIRVTESPRAPVPVAVSLSRQRPAAPRGLPSGKQIPSLPAARQALFSAVATLNEEFAGGFARTGMIERP